MKKIVHPISLCLLSLGLCIGSNSFAQESKTTIIEKQIEVSDENGEMTVKITTTKDGKTTVKELKGNEAKSFVEKHHEKGTMHHGGKKMHKKRFVTKDVNVTEKNGEKVVTITTSANGNEDVKVLTGEDAEHFLKDHHERAMIIHHDKKHGKHLNKNINISIENGQKVVTVTTHKNGNEEVEVFTGEEAEKFLKQHHERAMMHHGQGHPHEENVFITVDSENAEEGKMTINVNGDNMVIDLNDGKMKDNVMFITMDEDDNGKTECTKIVSENGKVVCTKNGKMVWTEMGEGGNISHEEIQKILKEKGIASGDLDLKVYKHKGNNFHVKGKDHTMVWTSDDNAPHGNIVIELDGDSINIKDMIENMALDIDLEEILGGSESKTYTITKQVIIDDMDTPTQKSSGLFNKSLELDDLNFYPNPNNGKFTLTFTPENSRKTDISIKDLTGKEIYSDAISGEGTVTKDIDISNQSTGVYILTLKQGSKSLSKKLLVE